MAYKPEMKLPPERYQPTRREMLEDASIDATPDELAEAVLRPVSVIHARQARPKKNRLICDCCGFSPSLVLEAMICPDRHHAFPNVQDRAGVEPD